MSTFFGGIEYVFIYLDDIFIASHSKEEHSKTVETVHLRALDANSTHNLDKSQLAQSEIRFLGRILTKNEEIPHLGVANRLFQGPRPSTNKELKAIIPALNCYHFFIPGLASLTGPLIDDNSQGLI